MGAFVHQSTKFTLTVVRNICIESPPGKAQNRRRNIAFFVISSFFPECRNIIAIVQAGLKL
jgi:hypothetical protein